MPNPVTVILALDYTKSQRRWFLFENKYYSSWREAEKALEKAKEENVYTFIYRLQSLDKAG